MIERGMGDSKDNPHLAARAALLTRAAKRDIDRGALERGWKRQAKARSPARQGAKLVPHDLTRAEMARWRIAVPCRVASRTSSSGGDALAQNLDPAGQLFPDLQSALPIRGRIARDFGGSGVDAAANISENHTITIKNTHD